MSRKSLLTSACILCAMITTLFIHGSYARDYREMGMEVKTNECVPKPALPGYKWYGTAPSCKGKKAEKDCTDAGGTVMDPPSACGDGAKCTHGYKILCRMQNYDQYQKAPDTTSNQKAPDTTTSTGTFSRVEVQGESSASGTETENTSPTYINTVNPKYGTTSSIRYIGNPPFCNADNKVRECTDMKGKEVGRSKCNEPGKYQKCCKTGKYLQCLAPDIRGGE